MNRDSYNIEIKRIIEVAAAMPEIEPPTGFRERVMQAVADETLHSSEIKNNASFAGNFSRRIRKSFVFIGATAACVVFVFFAIGIIGRGGSSKSAGYANSTAQYAEAPMAPAAPAPAAAPMPSGAPAEMALEQEMVMPEEEMLYNGVFDEIADEEYVVSTSVAENQIARTPSPAEANADAGAGVAISGSDAQVGSTPVDDVIQKIIKTSYYNLQVTEFDQTVSKIQQIAEAGGGFVESLNTNVYQTYSGPNGMRDLKNGYICLRIPQNNYATAKIKIENLGKIMSTSESIENITSIYVDMSARLEVKKSEEQRLLELYSKADEIEDLIAIETRLTIVRSDIESMISQLQNWDRSVSFSTINISIDEVVDYSQIQPVDPSLGEKIIEGFNRSVASFTHTLERMIIGIAENIIGLLIFAAVAFIVLSVVIIIKRKRRSGKNEM